MTRETKIGLLVGLAFIIVIGVLLSDHLTSATNPKMSTEMVGVGDKAYTSIVTPGGPNANKSVAITPASNVLPPEQVPTHTELAPRPADPVTANIDISAARLPDRGSTAIAIDNNTSTNVLPVKIADGSPVTPVAPVISSITAVRPKFDSDIVAPPRAEKREYKAQAGDTVSKMAYKQYGKNTKELRDLIVKANPSLQRSPDKIVVGQVYIIPPAPSAASQDTVATSTAARTMMAISTTQPTVSTSAGASVKTYTVKANDNIWRIATEQCHDIKAAKAILALNKDVLKGSDKLQVGMKLKLPEKKIS
jgi:nucleoid-associated protein YgaU